MKILNRWTQAVLRESAADTLRDAVLEAVACGADLGDADLRDADLGGADLRGADLGGADLGGADLGGANLGGADLGGADLRGANLRGANLRGADLRGADLGDANLRGADLGDANHSAPLRMARNDLWAVLDAAPNEVAGLLAAVEEGRVNGSTYEGDCACLLGTIGNVRGCRYDVLGILPDSSRPAERWFLSLTPGHTPEISVYAALTAAWIKEWRLRHTESAG